MNLVAFDTETHLIQPGLAAPPLVCGSAATPSTNALYGAQSTRNTLFPLFFDTDHPPTIVGANIAYDMLVMANDAIQRGVNPFFQIFEAYRQGRVHDIQIAEALHAIANGHLYKYPDGRPLTDARGKQTKRYSLDNCVRLNLGRENAKENDFWRLRYALLAPYPVEEWPQRAAELRGMLEPDYTCTQYPVDDAVNTLEVAQHQLANHDNLHDVPVQTFKHFCLQLGAAWGLRTDPDAVAELEEAANKGYEAGKQQFIDAGFLRWKRDKGELKLAGVQAVQKRAVAIAYGCVGDCEDCDGAGRIITQRVSEKTGKPLKPSESACKRCDSTGLDLSSAPLPMNPPTEKAIEKAEATGAVPYGTVQYGRDVLTESGDEFLMSFGAWQEDKKVRETYLPFLKRGIDTPYNPRPNPVLDTGRVSYEDVVQQLPRQISPFLRKALAELGSKVRGVRDCIIPRPGHVFYSVDYEGGELVTFSESAVERVGFSQMGEALNSGVKVHDDVAAMFLGIPYEEFLARRKAGDKQCKDARQAAKPVDFGCPGGIGAPKIVLQQRKSGPDTEWEGGPVEVRPGVMGYKGLRFCLLAGRAERCGEEKVTQWGRSSLPPTCKTCIVVANEIKEALFARYQELRPYLDWHAENIDSGGYAVQLYSGRKRGGTNFCSDSNGDFQALLADIYARATIRVVVEQYTGRLTMLTERVDVPGPYGGTVDTSQIFEWGPDGSPLEGSRNSLALHDENFGECREELLHEVGHRVSEVMVEEFQKGCPRHAAACRAEPAGAFRWFKEMEPVYHGGRLVPWTPEHDPRSCAGCG